MLLIQRLFIENKSGYLFRMKLWKTLRSDLEMGSQMRPVVLFLRCVMKRMLVYQNVRAL